MFANLKKYLTSKIIESVEKPELENNRKTLWPEMMVLVLAALVYMERWLLPKEVANVSVLFFK